MTQTLSQLENSGAFIERHIGPDAAQQQEMLNAVGAQSLNALTGQIVPKDIQLATPPQVGAPATEYAALAELKAIASRNKRFTSYIGMGYTAVQLPPVILRNMLENPGWYTAYTPYQPEVSQGRLAFGQLFTAGRSHRCRRSNGDGETRQQTEKCQPLLRGFRCASANAGCGPYSCRNLWF